jgi:hypothetical protein
MSAERNVPCEKFLYGFKAARRAARAADTAARPALTPGLPCRTVPNAGRLARRPKYPGPADHGSSSTRQSGWLPLRHCAGRAEPVKGAFGVGFAADP